MSQEEKTINLNLSHFFLPIILNTSLKLQITILKKKKNMWETDIATFLYWNSFQPQLSFFWFSN